MKQIIALVATAAVSASMFAQGIDKRDIIIEPNPNEQEQCCMDAPKPACPFEGIKLSDKQKDALKALDESRKADFEKKMADKRAERDAKKAEKIAEKLMTEAFSCTSAILAAVSSVNFVLSRIGCENLT